MGTPQSLRGPSLSFAGHVLFLYAVRRDQAVPQGKSAGFVCDLEDSRVSVLFTLHHQIPSQALIYSSGEKINPVSEGNNSY